MHIYRSNADATVAVEEPRQNNRRAHLDDCPNSCSRRISADLHNCFGRCPRRSIPGSWRTTNSGSGSGLRMLPRDHLDSRVNI